MPPDQIIAALRTFKHLPNRIRRDIPDDVALILALIARRVAHADKIQSFNWAVQEIDGHDLEAIDTALTAAQETDPDCGALPISRLLIDK